MCEHELFEVTTMDNPEIKKYICRYCDYKEERQHERCMPLSSIKKTNLLKERDIK